MNPYDLCVGIKEIYGKQVAITLHVVDLKVFPVDNKEVSKIIKEL